MPKLIHAAILLAFALLISGGALLQAPEIVRVASGLGLTVPTFLAAGWLLAYGVIGFVTGRLLTCDPNRPRWLLFLLLPFVSLVGLALTLPLGPAHLGPLLAQIFECSALTFGLAVCAGLFPLKMHRAQSTAW